MSRETRDEDPAGSVVVECELPERPETVWRALTVPEIVAEWLGPNTLRPHPGEAFTVKVAPEEGGAIACEVLEAIPHERLSYSWRTTEPDRSGHVLDTVVSFELVPTPQGGTHLRVVHRGLQATVATPVTMMGTPRRLAQLRPFMNRRDRRTRGRLEMVARRPTLASLPRRAA